MKHKVLSIICLLALVCSIVGCGKCEETTVTGMVVSVEGTKVSIVESDLANFEIKEGEMPEGIRRWNAWNGWKIRRYGNYRN